MQSICHSYLNKAEKHSMQNNEHESETQWSTILAARKVSRVRGSNVRGQQYQRSMAPGRRRKQRRGIAPQRYDRTKKEERRKGKLRILQKKKFFKKRNEIHQASPPFCHHYPFNKLHFTILTKESTLEMETSPLPPYKMPELGLEIRPTPY